MSTLPPDDAVLERAPPAIVEADGLAVVIVVPVERPRPAPRKVKSASSTLTTLSQCSSGLKFPVLMS